MKNKFKDLLIKTCYCRLQPSPIHGVGVFAIRDIPKGIDPMQEARTVEFDQCPVSEIMDDDSISPEIKLLVKDMCPENDGVFDVPPFSLNEIGLSFYLNHSKDANMEENDGYFFSKREIKSGEELTVDYGTYGELNL